MSLKERKKYWLSNTWRQVRNSSEESGNDDFSVFNKELYNHWKGVDDKFDEIMDFVIEELEELYYECYEEGELTKIINQQLGR